MTAKKSYTVHRSMHGEGRDYERGDTRKLTEADAAPLVATGALSPDGEEPIVREPGVQHLFGTGESDTANGGYTTATGDGVVAGRSAGEPARKPARKQTATSSASDA